MRESFYATARMESPFRTQFQTPSNQLIKEMILNDKREEKRA